MIRLSFPIVAAVIGALAVGGAILLNIADDSASPPDEAAVTDAQDTPADGARETETAAAPADDTNETAAAPQAQSVPPSPAFDVVRIDRDGAAVIAGRAAPQATVSVLRDGEVIGDVTADERGEWVFVPDAPLEPGSAMLSLAMKPDGDDVVIPSQEDVVVIVPRSPADTDAEPTQTADSDPAQAVVMKIGKDGASTLMQHPEPTVVAEGADLPLSIDTVDYDPEGRISIGGRAPAGAQVVLYIDNGVVGRAQAGPKGRWRVTPEVAIAPGQHTVRADRIDPERGVVARVMIPFAREEFTEPLEPGDFVVVQPGNSLWRLARRTYGTGFEYTVIYAANADQIADPDLIYPGQIFKLPATN
jgi:nucleoid-associated protein YgaU